MDNEIIGGTYKLEFSIKLLFYFSFVFFNLIIIREQNEESGGGEWLCPFMYIGL